MTGRIVAGFFLLIIAVMVGVVVFVPPYRLATGGCGDSSTIPIPAYLHIPLYPDAQAVWVCNDKASNYFNVSFRTDAPPERVLDFYRGELTKPCRCLDRDTQTQLIAIWASGAVPQSLRDDPMHGSWEPILRPSASFSFDAVAVDVHPQWWLFGETVVSVEQRSIYFAADPAP